MKTNNSRKFQIQHLVSCNRGFTLIEILVGSAIALVGIMIFSVGVLSLNKSASITQTTLTRNELSMLVRRALTDRRALQVTINNNPLLYAVTHNEYSLVPGGMLISNQNYDLSIYSPSGVAISGPQGAPVYYTTDGFPCQRYREGKCQVSLQSTFLFQGIPQNNSQDRMIPTSQYPVGPNINVDFIQINYSISIAATDYEIERKEIFGSVFISFEDLGI